MFDTLYVFFRDTLLGNSNVINGFVIQDITLYGQSIPFRNYVAFLMTLVSIIVIFVLCCLFVYKIIKLIGGLIR